MSQNLPNPVMPAQAAGAAPGIHDFLYEMQNTP